MTAPSEIDRTPKSYADAPRLPEGERVDVRELVRGTTFEIEIGHGRGGFLIERAAAAPDAAILGLEIKRKWCAIVDARLEKRGLRNRVRSFSDDAKCALPRLGPDGIFSVIYLHFPDPWWKKRHQKRMVMSNDFLVQVARLLAENGELFIQTDVHDRAIAFEQEVEASQLFRAYGDEEGSPHLAENPYGARSPREHRAVADGLPVARLRYRLKR